MGFEISDVILMFCMTDGLLALLKEIGYIDYPELKFNEHESTEMPFRYVKDGEGKPIMPEVSISGPLRCGVIVPCSHVYPRAWWI